MMIFATLLIAASSGAILDMSSMRSLLSSYRGEVVEVIVAGAAVRDVVKLVTAGADMVCLNDTADDAAPKVPNSALRCYPYARIQSVVIPHSDGGAGRLLIQILPLR